MKTEVCIFNGHEVSFSLDKENNMMVNATEMANIFDKQVSEFTSNDKTKKFVEALCQIEDDFQNGISRFENEFSSGGIYVKVVKGGRGSGTWMDRRVALKFAAWLDPYFEVWVYSTIDNLLFGRHVERERSFERSLLLKHEAEILISKKEKTGEDFERYIAINNELRKERSVRKQLTTGAISEMQMEIKFLNEFE